MAELLLPPAVDPAPIFEFFRANYASELLSAAVGPLELFERLAPAALTFDELRRAVKLEKRAAMVLITALRAMGLIETAAEGRLQVSALGRQHLVRSSAHDVSGYIELIADSPAARQTLKLLQSNRPQGADPSDSGGVAFIFREGIESAMDAEASARRLTMALAGRAKNVAPVLARNMPLGNARVILDVGGGTGIYSFAYLQTHPRLRAIVFDRAEVLKVANELAGDYGVADRVELRAGDMFADPLPDGCDAVLLSNVLHDWDEPECERLIKRCADALKPGGRLLIHDAFLNDNLDGPLAIALYSAALFAATEGRAYSAAEYRGWLTAAGLVSGSITPTLVHCGVLAAGK